MKHVLVALDEAGRSDEAVLMGLELARRFDAKLDLVHVVDTGVRSWPLRAKAYGETPLAETPTGVRQSIAAHLRTRRHQGSALKLGSTPIEEFLHVLSGHPAKVLLEHAKSSGADLLVLGPHRRRGMFDFGGTTRAVLAKAECPVWLQNGWVRDLRQILAPVDLSEHSMAALAVARDLASKLPAKVVSLYCFINPGYYYSLDTGAPMVTAIQRVDELRALTRAEFEKRMKEFDWQAVPHEALFIEEEPVHGILARQDAADLIVMGTHGITGFAAAVLGSTAYGVLRSAHTPVLVLPHPERAYQI